MQPAALVRLKWSEFQRWLEPRRKTMERQRDEIITEQDAKWLATPAKSKAKGDAHDANKALLIRALEEKHFSEAIAEWQVRLERARLSDDAWGDMTTAEQFAISRALGGDLEDDDDEDEEPIENLTIARRPQQLMPPAPILSSASRTSNLSASSYTLVSPADLGSDDELYTAVSSYAMPTDDSDDEITSIPVPIHSGKGWGNGAGWSPWSSNHSSLHGSPDQPSSKSLPDPVGLGAFQSLRVEPKPTSKRPLDPDPGTTTKTRVLGPKYIGPQISDSDETSEEEADFERFKMVTRITKIVEFHHAAALADIDLALEIYNGRKTKRLGKPEEEVKVKQHEKQMVKLQATKESERKDVVSAERKKRRDELRNRSALRDSMKAADSANYDALFDPSAFQVDTDVNGTFVLRRQDSSLKQTENHSKDISSKSSRTSAPEVPRTRKQSFGRETPVASQSGWKIKPTSSALSQSHAFYDEESVTTPIPQRMADSPWSSTHPLANSVPVEGGDFHFPGGFPAESKAKGVPVTSAWGKKSSSLGKLPNLTDDDLGSQFKVEETPITVNRVSPVETETERPSSPSFSSSKKPNKKQRQANKKSGAATKAEPELASPSAPISVSSSKTLPATPHLDLSKTSVSSSSSTGHEELSSTPRPNVAHMMMKKQGLASGMARSTPVNGTDDPASTPRQSALRQLASVHDPNESGTEEETPWQRMMKKKAPTQASDPRGAAEASKQETSGNRTGKQKSQIPDHRRADLSASTSLAEEEESPWTRMMRLKAQGQAPQAQANSVNTRASDVEEETPWQRAMRLKGQNQAPASANTIPSKPQEDESPWERSQRLKAESQNPWSTSSVTAKSMIDDSDSRWERMVGTAQQALESFATTSAKPQVGPSSGMRQSQLPNNHALAPPPDLTSSNMAQHPVRQVEREFWHPRGVTPSASHHQMWNPSGQTQPPHMEKSSSMATPSSRSQEANRVRRVSDPVSSSPRLEFSDLPDANDRYDFVPTSILKGKSKQPPTKKKVTIEEVPDEEGRMGSDEKLPTNSRYLLDIAEPKPSVPPNLYTRFFDFEAEEDEVEEDDTELSSLAPTPSTAPTSPPGEIPTLDDDELMAEIQNGGWENLLAGSPSKPTKNANHAQWPTSSLANGSSQALDSAKLLSALQSVNGSPSVEKKTDVSPKPAASVVPPVPENKDNKDPGGKSNKDVKGKAKGKGADKKGKGGRK